MTYYWFLSFSIALQVGRIFLSTISGSKKLRTVMIIMMMTHLLNCNRNTQKTCIHLQKKVLCWRATKKVLLLLRRLLLLLSPRPYRSVQSYVSQHSLHDFIKHLWGKRSVRKKCKNDNKRNFPSNHSSSKFFLSNHNSYKISRQIFLKLTCR